MLVKPVLVPSVALLYLLLYPFAEAYLLAVALFLGVAILQWNKTRSGFNREVAWPLILGLFIAAPLILTLFVASNLLLTFNDVLRFSLLGLVASFFVMHFRGKVFPEVWLAVIACFICFWVFDALLQYMTGHNLLGYPMRSQRLTGLWYPSIGVGTIVAHSSPLLVEAIRRFTQRHGGWSHLLWVLILPMLAVVALGGSRASWVAFILVMALYLFYLIYIGYVRLIWVVLFASALAALSSFMYFQLPEFQSRIDRTLFLFSGDFDQVNHATSGRLPIWHAAWVAFIENPLLGIGAGALESFAEQNQLQGVTVRYAHFFLLDVLSMTGLVGFLGYACFYGILCFHTAQALRNRWDIAAVFLICALIMAFPANSHWGFYNYRPVGLLWLFIGMGYGLRYHELCSIKDDPTRDQVKY